VLSFLKTPIMFLKRISLLLFVFILCSINASSQYSIKGKLLNLEKKPIDFAQVYLLQDSTIIRRELTDSLGEFIISQNGGKYILNIIQMNKIL
jgi:hypothetical protein